MGSSEFWKHLQQPFTMPLFSIGGTPVSLTTVLAGVLVLVGGFFLSRLLRHSVRSSLLRRGVRLGTSAAIERLVHYVVLVVTVSIALQTLGVNLGALFTAGAVFAVALGFAMQTIVQNFVSGLILLIERSIKPGDVISLEGKPGRVQAMRIRSTIVENWDGEQLVVPNSALVQSTVKNYTLDESHMRIRARVGVSYSSDMERVGAVLLAVGESAGFRIPASDVQVLMVGFGNNSVDWEVAVWSDDPWTMRNALSALHREIWDAFAREGIVIAFPQLDVHFDPPVVEGLARIPRPALTRAS